MSAAYELSSTYELKLALTEKSKHAILLAIILLTD